MRFARRPDRPCDCARVFTNLNLSLSRIAVDQSGDVAILTLKAMEFADPLARVNRLS